MICHGNKASLLMCKRTDASKSKTSFHTMLAPQFQIFFHTSDGGGEHLALLFEEEASASAMASAIRCWDSRIISVLFISISIRFFSISFINSIFIFSIRTNPCPKDLTTEASSDIGSSLLPSRSSSLAFPHPSSSSSTLPK